MKEREITQHEDLRDIMKVFEDVWTHPIPIILISAQCVLQYLILHFLYYCRRLIFTLGREILQKFTRTSGTIQVFNVKDQAREMNGI